MPVTARLSKAFYDKLGEQVAIRAEGENGDSIERDIFSSLTAGGLVQPGGPHVPRRVPRAQRPHLRPLRCPPGAAGRDARLHVRLDRFAARLDAKLDASVAERAFTELGARIRESSAALSARLEHGLRVQVMWLLGAWGLVFATIVGLWIRR